MNIKKCILNTILLISATTISSTDAQLPESCARIDVRREWNDLTPAEQRRFTSAVNQLRLNGQFDVFSQTHVEQNMHWHNGPMFFPSHRLFIYLFEQALRAIDDSIVLPYWDWSLNSDNWWANPIWLRFGDAAPEQCINRDFSNFMVQNPTRHCVRRGVDHSGGNSPFVATEVLGDITQNTTTSYSHFALEIEFGSHAQVHNALGVFKNRIEGQPFDGDMAYPFSPNDPIFYLHHGMVDKLWWNWQQAKPSRFSEINGRQNNVPLTLQSIIAPYDIRIRDIMDPRQLCYRYAVPGEPRQPSSTSTSSTSRTTTTATISSNLISTTVYSTSTSNRSSSSSVSTSSSSSSSSSIRTIATTSTSSLSSSVSTSSRSSSSSIRATTATTYSSSSASSLTLSSMPSSTTASSNTVSSIATTRNTTVSNTSLETSTSQAKSSSYVSTATSGINNQTITNSTRGTTAQSTSTISNRTTSTANSTVQTETISQTISSVWNQTTSSTSTNTSSWITNTSSSNILSTASRTVSLSSVLWDNSTSYVPTSTFISFNQTVTSTISSSEETSQSSSTQTSSDDVTSSFTVSSPPVTISTSSFTISSLSSSPIFSSTSLITPTVIVSTPVLNLTTSSSRSTSVLISTSTASTSSRFLTSSSVLSSSNPSTYSSATVSQTQVPANSSSSSFIIATISTSISRISLTSTSSPSSSTSKSNNMTTISISSATYMSSSIHTPTLSLTVTRISAASTSETPDSGTSTIIPSPSTSQSSSSSSTFASITKSSSSYTVSISKSSTSSASLPTFEIKKPRLPDPLPTDFIKRMGYNETQIRDIENELRQKYDGVQKKLLNGEFVAGPGINASHVIGVPTVPGQSVFGGPDPYLKGSWSVFIIDDDISTTVDQNSDKNGTTRLFNPVVDDGTSSQASANQVAGHLLALIVCILFF